MLNSREACRGGFPCPVEDVKEAAHCATYHGPEGSLVNRIATAIGVKSRTFSDQLNPNEPDYLSAKNLPTVVANTASYPVLSQYFAGLQGGLVFFPPKGQGFDKTTATSVKEFGEFLQAAAADGGVMTPAKMRRIRKEGEDAMRAIKAALDHVEQLAAAAQGGK